MASAELPGGLVCPPPQEAVEALLNVRDLKGDGDKRPQEDALDDVLGLPYSGAFLKSKSSADSAWP